MDCFWGPLFSGVLLGVSLSFTFAFHFFERRDEQRYQYELALKHFGLMREGI